MVTTTSWRRIVSIVAFTLALAGSGQGIGNARPSFLTAQPPMITLDPSAPAGSSVLPIINSGETIGDFMFEGIPDGIGAMPGSDEGTVDVFINHEQSHVPFLGLADFVDASVSKLTLDTSTGDVLAASVALPPDAGFLRFCSSTMGTPAQGLDRYLYFTNEETNDIVPVPPGAPYGPDPSLAPDRQGGYAVVLDPATGAFTQVPGMGRHNHENDMVIPGGWSQIAVLSGDDTFTPPGSQLYLYLADSTQDVVDDHGSLWAFRVTATQDGKVDEKDPFNGANDYLDIQSGDVWQGRFIRVPTSIARGTTSDAPQTALENWSNQNNVFQFVRIEDTAFDPNDPRVVYFADTGTTRIVPDPVTGRMKRGPSGTVGQADNGRIFQMEFSADNPRKVDSFSILLNGDAGEPAGLGPIHQPDNLGTSTNSLMVQEDTAQVPPPRIWRYDFATATWSIVAAVNDQDWESSGIVDASPWFGSGAWLLDVQAHDVFVDSEPDPDDPTVTLKREGGQLLLMTIPGS